MKFRTFQTICQYIALALFVCLIGIIGGMQHDSLPFGVGVVLSVVDMGLAVFFAYCGGMFY